MRWNYFYGPRGLQSIYNVSLSARDFTFTLWKQGSWWRHQMETFSALLAICAGSSPVPGELPAPHKGQWRGALMFSLIWVWIKGWENNREAGDLRRYRAYYDVIVMLMPKMNSHTSLHVLLHIGNCSATGLCVTSWGNFYLAHLNNNAFSNAQRLHKKDIGATINRILSNLPANWVTSSPDLGTVWNRKP